MAFANICASCFVASSIKPFQLFGTFILAAWARGNAGNAPPLLTGAGDEGVFHFGVHGEVVSSSFPGRR